MFLVLGFLLALFGSGRALQEEKEKWWDAGQTQMNVWDHSWLTPRQGRKTVDEIIRAISPCGEETCPEDF